VRAGLYGFELGNELDGGDYTTKSSVEATVLANDYLTLRALIDQYWPEEDLSKPILVGPAQHPNLDFAKEFLTAAGHDTLDVFTFHDYVGYGLDPKLPEKIMNKRFLDAFWDGPKETVEAARALAPSAEIWMGEGSAAWHSGQCGTTDKFRGSFWFANALGLLASHGVHGFARHSFNGGCYSQVDRETFAPNPDYWIALLWRQIMGDDVLDVRSLALGGADALQADDFLLAYGHTARNYLQTKTGDGAALLFINLSGEQSFQPELSAAPGLTAPRYEYALTAESLASGEVSLNGAALALEDDGSLPVITGRFVNDTTVPIVVAPHSIVFVELPGACIY
jgi:heparanase 1